MRSARLLRGITTAIPLPVPRVPPSILPQWCSAAPRLVHTPPVPSLYLEVRVEAMLPSFEVEARVVLDGGESERCGGCLPHRERSEGYRGSALRPPKSPTDETNQQNVLVTTILPTE